MKSYQVNIGAGIILIGIIGLLITNPIRIIDSGTVGVIYKFGKVSQEVLQPYQKMDNKLK
jgi:regulator of protease activity HflC (stomatin/prohibitin superfamily)